MLLRLVHLMTAAVWFAATLTTAGDVRRGLLERASRSLTISLIAGLLANSTGLALVLLRGGFRAFGPRMHVAFGLALAALIVEAQVLAPMLRATDPKAHAGRFAAVTGALHLLRSVVFVLMVLR